MTITITANDEDTGVITECECPECTKDTGSPMYAYCEACDTYMCGERCWARWHADRQARADASLAVDWDEPEYWRD